MKRFVLFAALCVNTMASQSPFVRVYPQPQPPSNFNYSTSEMSEPLKLPDGGYLMAAEPWGVNLHMAYPIDQLTIRTSSGGSALWKKQTFTKTVLLPTGSLLMLHSTVNDQYYSIQFGQFSKMDLSGTAAWTKTINSTTSMPFKEVQLLLQDFVVTGTNVICSGTEMLTDIMTSNLDARGYIAVLDTNGNLLSEKRSNMPANSVNGRSGFDRIIAIGAQGYLLGDRIGGSLHKISLSLAPVWSFEFTGTKYTLLDAHTLSNGNTLCLLETWSHSADTNNVVLCLNPSGNAVFAKRIPLKGRFGGMCKTSDGNFIITALNTKVPFVSDSIRKVVIKIDSNANYQWGRTLDQAIGISKAVSKGNNILFSFYNDHFAFQSGTLSGDFTCGNSPLALNLSAVNVSTLTITQAFSPVTFSNGTGSTYTNSAQSHADSCFLTVGIAELPGEDWRIGPNPVSDRLFVKTESVTESAIQIYNVEGRVIFSCNIVAGEIDITALPEGIYLLVIREADIVKTRRRIIIER